MGGYTLLAFRVPSHLVRDVLRGKFGHEVEPSDAFRVMYGAEVELGPPFSKTAVRRMIICPSWKGLSFSPPRKPSEHTQFRRAGSCSRELLCRASFAVQCRSDDA